MKLLIRQLARATRTSHAEAADSLNRLVHGIIRRTRTGEVAHVPGLGTFAARTMEFHPEANRAGRR